MSSRIAPQPCPFCGSDPVYRSSMWNGYESITLACENPACMVRPQTIIGAGKAMAIAMWNRRANVAE